MRVIITVVVTFLVALIIAIGLAYSGIVNVGAGLPHSGTVSWFLSTTSSASIKRHSRTIEAPDLNDEPLILAGAGDFDSMCRGCHGAPGKAREAVGLGLYPPAPNLAEAAARLNSAELFWVTKHGIRMTGMPAWGATHADAEIWPVVAFMTKLPDLDADGYSEIVASAMGMGHHAPGESHDAMDDHEAPQSDPAAAGDDHEHDANEPNIGSHNHAETAPVTESETHHDDHDHTH